MESVILALIVLAASAIGGYAVLRKKVQDLEESNKKKLDIDKHGDLCKIVTLEMKKHVSDAMKETLDAFKDDVFQPAITQVLNAINGGKK